MHPKGFVLRLAVKLLGIQQRSALFPLALLARRRCRRCVLAGCVLTLSCCCCTATGAAALHGLHDSLPAEVLVVIAGIFVVAAAARGDLVVSAAAAAALQQNGGDDGGPLR